MPANGSLRYVGGTMLELLDRFLRENPIVPFFGTL